MTPFAERVSPTYLDSGPPAGQTPQSAILARVTEGSGHLGKRSRQRLAAIRLPSPQLEGQDGPLGFDIVRRGLPGRLPDVAA